MTILVCHTHGVELPTKAAMQLHMAGNWPCDMSAKPEMPDLSELGSDDPAEAFRKPREFKPDWDTDAVKARFAAREAAHQAVKAFDLAPNIQNTTAAIEALSEFEQHLKEETDGR